MGWLIFALAAALLTGLNVVIEKKTLLKEHAMEFATVYALFTFVISLVLIPKVNLDLTLRQFGLVYFASIFTSLIILFEAKGIRHLEVSIAAPLLNFAPALTAIIAFLFLKETLSLTNLSGIGLIVFGGYFLETHKLSIHFLEPLKKLVTHKYTLYMLLAMVLLSILVVINKTLLQNIDVYTYIVVYGFFTALNLIALIIIFHDGFKGIVHGIQNAGAWILVMAILLFTARLLYFNALHLFKASLVFSVIKTNTFFSTVLGGALFHERHFLARAVAASIMAGGVFLVTI
jgi:bacterial/archaeal transporter family protein